MSRLSRERDGAAESVPELSPRQVEVLAAIELLMKRQGYPPSFQAIADLLGISKSTVHADLHGLAEKGIIELGDGPRTLRVLKPITPALAIIITAERAWQWLKGEDHSLEQQLRQLAYAHEETLRANPRPLCDLCHGDGRFDDIFCPRCGGDGRQKGGDKRAPENP